jgi:hypothetical protein
VTISTPGTNVQLYQTGLTLEPRTRYRLKLAAYSSTGHNVRLSLLKHGAPFTNYGLNWTVDCSGSWQEYSTEFTTTGLSAIVDDARLRFAFNDFAVAGDQYFIDNVFLEKISNTSPVITSHPQDRTVWRFQTATFTVAATGAGPLSYQWQMNGVNIAAATGTSYSTPPVDLPDDGTQYRCVVTNPYGAAYSNAAVLHVLPGINVLQNPGFESGTQSWSFYTNGAGTFDTYAHSNASGVRCAGVAVSAAGTNVQVLQTGMPLQPNTVYRLTFSAYSSTGHNMAVFLQKHTSPYTNYGVNGWVVDLAPEWHNFTKTFTTTGFGAATTDTRLRFWFAPYDAAGDRFFIDDVWLGKVGPGKESPMAELPAAYALHQNYPNPFNPTTTIEYGIPERGFVSLKVFDVLGREIATLVDEVQEAGVRSVEWDASLVASGMYFCRLQAGGFRDTRKMLLTK